MNALADHSQEVEIIAGRIRLVGYLSVPSGAQGMVLFAHGSGSGRHSPRNQFVAQILQEGGLGTLLVDLLEEEEAQDRERVFDIPLLAQRLGFAAQWLASQPETFALSMGLFGASTGAAAALLLAAREPERCRAVVSRGGRPDLALEVLDRVEAPTRLIVGGQDRLVLTYNRQALVKMNCIRNLVVIPQATHLFPEPGALEKVADLALEWFTTYLPRREGGNHVS